jgi:inner membrane protein
MNRAFIFKIIGMLLLIALMSIAVSYVNGIILERQQRQHQVKADIARGSAGEQTIVGPVLVVPYIEEFSETTSENGVKKTEVKREQRKAVILPDQLNFDGGFTNEFKKLGIYKALIYQLNGNIKGSFVLPADIKLTAYHNNSVITMQPAYLSMGITDPRGIGSSPAISWGNQTLNFKQGSQLSSLGNGIHAPVGLLQHAAETRIAFDINLNLRGTEQFNFAPVAGNNKVALHSSWQHPHFDGSFLPEASTQKINASGFIANWAVSSLSSNNQAIFFNQLAGEQNQNLELLNVGFVEPINVYSQSDRATKYGLLFIGLTFAGFFIFEILKNLRIHPAQYTLVGLSMAMFYLLLVSLAEQIGFASAYFSASAACIVLLGYYLSYVLKSKANGIMFATLLTALYGALYGILQSEDNALLMGSLMVFGLLALVMVITRKVDWYKISSKPEVPTVHSSYDVV